ncbi:GNAT family N-acetyltransferase [Rossellomorea marisflavi]|uniref:GNAT family N-acetyltransferase n=1 Tax=Rossellomorea marisflavi TaxID=189381 RepID=UPI0020420295|nr:GNAT family N-acetyltransferase [Rossellomorea marisflavi]MCM2588110.1 GNAT family N-acetyltransferase [Rossellomorea marisflavi]
MKIKRVHEYELDDAVRRSIQDLLLESFGKDYPKARIYFKQLPHFRYLVLNDDNMLVAQVGLDYRVMNLNGRPVYVLGVIDLCVKKEYRSNGLGSLLLSEIEKISEDKSIDFLLLFADHKVLYLKNGYRSVMNECTWLKIDHENYQSLGVGKEVMNELMMKEIGNVKWEDGCLDLLGYLY